jgi:integral membrane protein
VSERRDARDAGRVASALTRFRVMAWLAGIGLLLLCVSMFLRYALDIETILDVVPRIHGFVYIGYLITVIDLATRMRWSWGRGIVIALAGTVPFLSFVAEHKVTLQTRAELAAA